MVFHLFIGKSSILPVSLQITVRNKYKFHVMTRKKLECGPVSYIELGFAFSNVHSSKKTLLVYLENKKVL